MRATAHYSYSSAITEVATRFAEAIATRAASLAMTPVRFYRSRAVMARLAALSDHELQDIGVTRTDLNAVTGLPSEVDPTHALAQIVQERRRWRRGG